jgi:hypothetical protein
LFIWCDAARYVEVGLGPLVVGRGDRTEEYRVECLQALLAIENEYLVDAFFAHVAFVGIA